MGRYLHGKSDRVLRFISPGKPGEIGISSVIAVIIVQHAAVIVCGRQLYRDISGLHFLIRNFDHTDIRLGCIGLHDTYRHRNVQNRVIAVIHAKCLGFQSKIFSRRLCVQTAKRLPLFSPFTEWTVVFVIHVAVFNQYAGQLLLHGMPYDTIVIRPLFSESGLDASRVKTEILKRSDFNVGKSIPFAVMLPKSGHPAFRSEKRVVIL